MNNSINNWYCNRFINIGRPNFFFVNHNGTSLCLQSRPHLGSRWRVSVTLARHRLSNCPIYDPSQMIATRQLDALTVASTRYICNNSIYFRSNLLCWYKLSCNRLNDDERLIFLPEASFGLRVLSLPGSVCLWVRPSVCAVSTCLSMR